MLTSLCFLLQQSYSLQKTDSILFWHTATEFSIIEAISYVAFQLWNVDFCGYLTAGWRPEMSPIYFMSP